LKTIDLALLGQEQPDSYKLAPGDVLGIWIEWVLGERGALPPVQLAETGKEPPALGYPVPVRENGTLSLPLVDPVRVNGMSIDEAEAAITRAYTEAKQILQPGHERIIVTLMRKRKYHVLVVRQESGAPPITGGASRGGLYGTTNILGGGKQGTGHALDLPAYQNDVLNALVAGGHHLSEPIDGLIAPLQGVVTLDTPLFKLKDIFADDNVAVVKEGEKVTAIVTKIDLIEYLGQKSNGR
jgi:hypothetical protein